MDNSVVGVTVLLAVLVLRQADFWNPDVPRIVVHCRDFLYSDRRTEIIQHGFTGTGIFC